VRKWTRRQQIGGEKDSRTPGLRDSRTPTTQKCRIQGHETCVMAGNQSMKLISNWFWPLSPAQSLQEVDQRKCETINSNERRRRRGRKGSRSPLKRVTSFSKEGVPKEEQLVQHRGGTVATVGMCWGGIKRSGI